MGPAEYDVAAGLFADRVVSSTIHFSDRLRLLAKSSAPVHKEIITFYKMSQIINGYYLKMIKPFPFGASVCNALTSSAHLSGDSIPLLWSYVMP